MMREIVLDTETTGISPADGHRVVEIGAVELLNHVPTGKVYHVYLNPERDMPPEAQAVHGLSIQFLKDKPLFAQAVDEFLAFVEDASLVIHNAAFDVGFLNAELSRLDRAPIDFGRVVDTLQIARRRHPMASNSLDALCKRYGVDDSRRTKHGALLDAELLAEVYLELIGGRQQALQLASVKPKGVSAGAARRDVVVTRTRERALPSRLTDEEKTAHDALVKELGPEALWLK